jgi:signal transduction histidine kinase
MKRKIANRFLINYLLMFVISIMVGLFALMLLGFASDLVSKTLIKNDYTAESLMRDDYKSIDITSVVDNGGGVQVIDTNYVVVLSGGLNTLPKDKLTAAEFTDFLIESKSIGIPYSYSIEYNSNEQFWLVVTFPTSLRIGLDIGYNKDFIAKDMQNVAGVIVSVVLFYLLLLAVSTVIYSKLTSIGIVNPLKMLCSSARRLKDGDYTARVDLNLENEFGELQDSFNAMAQKIEQEIYLRKQSEENRKKLVLDISHDLKNPLASVMGYAELCRGKPDLSRDELDAYTKIIYENSVRSNNLINDLFELSKMDSSEYTISKVRIDICEYLREKIGAVIPILDDAGFYYDFYIPEEEIFVELDISQMDRVIQNLIANAVKYNAEGTKVTIGLSEQHDTIVIEVKDDGIGIPAEIADDIFNPFVRADRARNSQTGGTGLGLAIVEKIIAAHGGKISLKTDENLGCEFIIHIPKR